MALSVTLSMSWRCLGAVLCVSGDWTQCWRHWRSADPFGGLKPRLKKDAKLQQKRFAVEALGYLCTCIWYVPVYAFMCEIWFWIGIYCVQLDIAYTYIVALFFLWMSLEKQPSYLCVPQMGWIMIIWYIHTNNYKCIYMMAASGLPVPPPPPRMGWVQNLRFSYIFMEPAKTHGIYTVLTSSASETVVFAAFCNTTLYTTTLIVLLLQKQQQLLLLLPLLRTTTYYYVLLRITTYYYVLRIRTTTYFVYVLLRTTYTYYVLLRTTTYYYVLRRTTTCYYVLLRTTTYYYVLLRITTYDYVRLRTTTYYYVGIRTTYYYVLLRTTTYYYVLLRTTYYYVLRIDPPTHRGGGGNIMCICNIFVCIHNKNDMPTLLGHVHTYIQTNHKSIQTNSYHT